MKIMTILGTRPEIIRLSRIIPKLDELTEHVLVHTGQNFDARLSEIFFSELEVRSPDYHLDCRADSAMAQIGRILESSDRILTKVKPDRLLILGDTNSALSAIAAKRRGIRVFHMEAGNRCYDDRVPEEVNRRIVDHSSDILMPYTQHSRGNLLREGFPNNRVYVTGNPIYEVIEHYRAVWIESKILDQLGVETHKYFLVTLHRAENVDDSVRLKKFVDSLHSLAYEYALPLVISVHPRTRSRLQQYSTEFDNKKIIAIEPLGFIDFIKLEMEAFCVLSDSGTVQEECCIFNIPNITLRDVTERPETLEVGSNYITGCDTDSILRGVKLATNRQQQWSPPQEYCAKDVSSTVTRLALGHWLWK